MEASAIQHPQGLGRLPLPSPLLRLHSDEQLVAQFRAGNDEAFRVLHDRYRQRLFAYVRQMLAGASRQDAEDVMQDVFVRAFGALRADRREMNVRAWLYRVAHNRCIDHLRRPVPAPVEVYEVSRKPLHDPIEETQRREDLTRLVEDIGRLPEQQRSALLMRELDGMSYADLAAALDVTVPAVKSLLVRARIGLVDASEARDAACEEIRDDLLRSYDRGVKASGRARRHLRTCDGCAAYRASLRGVQRSLAALSPAGLGPLALVAKLLGAGGAGGGAAASGSAAAGGSAAGGAIAAGGMATATACKVAAVVCTAALTAGGAVEADRIVNRPHKPRPAAAAPAPAPPAARAAVYSAAPPVIAPRPALPHGTVDAKPGAAGRPGKPAAPAATPDPASAGKVVDGPPAPGTDAAHSGGVAAPVDTASPPTDTTGSGTATGDPAATDPASPSPTGTAPAGGSGTASETTPPPAPPAASADASGPAPPPTH